MKNTTKEFVKTNLIDYINFDYERSGCICNEYICRCTKIEHSWIEDVPVNKIINVLYEKYRSNNAKSIIDKYCFDRICHELKIYDKDLYEIEVTNGYYGEEVEGIYFTKEEELLECYEVIQNLNEDIDKIKCCLNFEYGYLIDSVRNATNVSVVTVSPKTVYCPQREYFHKLSTSVIDHYKSIQIPICVCIGNTDNYRLIDGYHRYAASKDKENVDIIVLE